MQLELQYNYVWCNDYMHHFIFITRKYSSQSLQMLSAKIYALKHTLKTKTDNLVVHHFALLADLFRQKRGEPTTIATYLREHVVKWVILLRMRAKISAALQSSSIIIDRQFLMPCGWLIAAIHVYTLAAC